MNMAVCLVSLTGGAALLVEKSSASSQFTDDSEGLSSMLKLRRKG